uniref:SLPTX10 n=1 Tax=Hemiscolopendra marginata TaxID=943146 RepID=A0A646QDC6_9MYRI
MIKTAVIVLTFLFVMSIIEECKALKVKDLKEPKSFIKAKAMAKDKLALKYIYDNRDGCMTNCKLVPTCHLLSPECCPKQTQICLQLDIVIEANKKLEQS